MASNSSRKSQDHAPAKRSLGQNFLTDDKVIDQIIGSLGHIDDKNVLEIGPGRGALTVPLLARGAILTVIELDDHLANRLSMEHAGNDRFTCINANILDTDISTLAGDETVIVGNLPYYISTAIIRHLIAYRGNFTKLVLMLQREVADRIAAQPGESERGFLTVLVEQYLTITKEFDVEPSAFSPQPKVWSSIVSLTPRTETISDDRDFERIVSAAFAQKRKTILNNLKHFDKDAAEILSAALIDGRRRAETLTRDEWVLLFETAKAQKKGVIAEATTPVE